MGGWRVRFARNDEVPKNVQVELTDEERQVLWCGLHEWGGPASCSDSLAVAMGFTDCEDLLQRAGKAIRESIREREPLEPDDWIRALAATEIVFASDIFGSGSDWWATTGIPDEKTIQLLRRLQAKIIDLR